MVSFCGASGQTDMVVLFSERRWLLVFHPHTLFSSYIPSFQDPSPSSTYSILYPNIPSPRHPEPWFPGLALTGDIELFCPLHSNTNTGEGHLTGDVSAVVLGPGCEHQL